MSVLPAASVAVKVRLNAVPAVWTALAGSIVNELAAADETAIWDE